MGAGSVIRTREWPRNDRRRRCRCENPASRALEERYQTIEWLSATAVFQDKSHCEENDLIESLSQQLTLGTRRLSMIWPRKC